MTAVPIAITMGDASGVGPEIVLRRFVSPGIGHSVVFGDVAILRHGVGVLGLDIDPAGQPTLKKPLCKALTDRKRSMFS